MMNRRRGLTLACSGLVAVATVALGRTPHAAELRVPASPAEVLERVPVAKDPRARELRRGRRARSEEPRSLASAVRVATLEIESARAEGDPRHLGRAQATLSPWWDSSEAPADVLVLRATIEQSLHDFDGALQSLDRALVLAPDASQAWLTRAVVLTVRGRYAEARSSCDSLERVATSLPVVLCRTAIASVTGDAARAEDDLAREIAERPPVRSETAWALSSLGEFAERAGHLRAAEAHYRRALELDPGDAYTRGALADLLLDGGRAAEVVPFVSGHETNDALLLRLAIAEREVGDAAAKEHEAALAARFDASRARGDVVHRREEARFWLTLRGDAARALDLARANWEVQREPWDVRILLEAALAAGPSGRSQAEAVASWTRMTGLEHPAIARAIAALDGR